MSDQIRTAVVSGASRGIGEVVTARLAERGFRVIALGRSQERLAEVASRTGAIPIAVDIAAESEVAAAWDRIGSEFGVPQLLINNAGIAGGTESTWEMSSTDWWRVFEVNVLGTFLMCRSALQLMLEVGGGRIVNVSSNAAFFALEPGDDSLLDSAYMASKAALIRLTEAMAAEVAHNGVSVFAISPGMVKTDMTRRVFSEYWDEPDVWAPAEATADLVEFIASGALDALSGRYIHAAADDWRSLAGQAAQVIENDWHAMRLRTPSDRT